LAWHVFTGCDVTGRFAGRTKDFCFKAFLECEDILKALASLGKTEEYPNAGIIASLEKFVCRLYKSKEYSKVGSHRWHLYAHKQQEQEQLPPTLPSLLPMIRRAQIVIRLQMQSSVSHPRIPPATNFGWVLEDGKLLPVRCTELPAPQGVLMLVKCNCKKGCQSSACTCFKNGMPCTELYGCAETCQNQNSNFEAADSSSDASDTSDED